MLPGRKKVRAEGIKRINFSETKRFIRLMVFHDGGDDMRAFKATGSFRVHKFERQKFTIEVAAENEADVQHKIFSNLGSKHKLSRRDIKIDEIKPIQGDEITDPVVLYLTGGHK